MDRWLKIVFVFSLRSCRMFFNSHVLGLCQWSITFYYLGIFMHSLACMDMGLWRRMYIECANQCFTLWRACAYWATLYHLHLRLNSKPLTENSAERLTARILLQNRLSSDTRHLVSESLSEAPTTYRCMQWEFLVASCDNNEERNMSDGYHGNGYQTMLHLFPH